MADARQSDACREISPEKYSALLSGAIARVDRAGFFRHASGCGACQARLLRDAPELLLAAAAEALPAPAPLELPPLPVRQSFYVRARAWQVAAMLLILLGGGALLLRRAGESGPVSTAARASLPQTVIGPPTMEIAATADLPAIESGADDYQIREYEAPGFDGKPAQWIRLTPAEPAAPVLERS